MSQICKGISYLVSDWRKMPEEVQSKFPREKLLLNFFSYMTFSSEAVPSFMKNRVKFFKTLLTIYLNFDSEVIFGEQAAELKVSRDDMLRILKNVSLDGYKLSKQQSNDKFFKEQQVHAQILELLRGMVKFAHATRVDILSSLIGALLT